MAQRTSVLLALLLAVATLATAQSVNDKERNDITTLEHRWLASLNDPQALASILADDFVHVLPSGIITKKQQLDYQRTHPRKDSMKRSLDKLRVRVYGDVAIANGAVVEVDERGGKRTTFFTDVFAKRNGRWQAANAQENAAAP
jgi:ketosteroid isomerase-like protein